VFGWGEGEIVPCVSNKTVISIIMYVDRALDFLWLCCGYWTRLVILWMLLRGESFHGIGVVALRILGDWEFSVRRPRGGRSVILLSSYEVC
jgi:hypothetical protein